MDNLRKFKKILYFYRIFSYILTKIEKEGGEGCITGKYKGIIKADENCRLLNIVESQEKRVRILIIF